MNDVRLSGPKQVRVPGGYSHYSISSEARRSGGTSSRRVAPSPKASPAQLALRELELRSAGRLARHRTYQFVGSLFALLCIVTASFLTIFGLCLLVALLISNRKWRQQERGRRIAEARSIAARYPSEVTVLDD